MTVLSLRGTPIEPEATIEEVKQAYDQGLYLLAFARARTWGDFRGLREPERMVLAARLAIHLGAPRLGSALTLHAGRLAPDNLEVQYFRVVTILQRQGPWFALRRLGRDPGQMERFSPQWAAAWFTLRAEAYSLLRDFESAERAQNQAERTAPDDPWAHLHRASVLEAQDRYPEALAVARDNLRIHPWYRPGVQQTAHLLVLQGHDEEAVDLLAMAGQRLESALLHAQLAALLVELDRHEAVWPELQLFEERSPLLEENGRQWLAARRADTASALGRQAEAARYAREVGEPFYTELAERLGDPSAPSRRVQLDVPFVRQHHLTCGPATLAAISRYWNRPADHLEVTEQICYDGTPAHGERNWAETSGWRVEEFSVTWESAVALLDARIPFTLTTQEPGSAHLQAVIGYDQVRRTLLLRDPFFRNVLELRAKEGLAHYAFCGPRGMAMVPETEAARLDEIHLPDAQEYANYHRLQLRLDRHDRAGAEEARAALEATSSAHRLTVMSRLSLGAYDDAVLERLAAAESLAEGFPEAEVPRFLLVNALGEAGYDERLRELLAQATSRPGAHPIFLHRQALVWGANPRTLDQAQRLLRRALRAQPTEASHYAALADVCWARRQSEEGLALYRVAACLADKNEAHAHTYFTASRHLRQTERTLELLRQRYARLGGKSGLPARTLFSALDALERTAEGLEMLEEAQARRPEDGDLALFRALELLRIGEDQRAEEILDEVRERVRPVDWRRAAAFLAMWRGQSRDALDHWRAVLAGEPFELRAHELCAELLADLEGPDAVEAHFAGYLERFPHHRGLARLAASTLAMSQPEHSLAILRRLRDNAPADLDTRRELARVLSLVSRHAAAEVEAVAALELEPQNASNHATLGRVLLEGGKALPAHAAFARAVRLFVDEPGAVELLLATCTTPEETREALRVIRTELRSQVTFGDALLAYRNGATGLLASGEILTTVEEANAARPDLWQTWAARAQQLADMDRLEEARSVAREATDRFPLLPAIWLQLADGARRAGDLADEVGALRQALAINPGWSLATIRLARALRRQADFEGARKVLKSAREREPRDGDLCREWANLLWAVGERTEALATIREAVRLSPEDEASWDRLRDWAEKTKSPAAVVKAATELTEQKPGRASSWYVLALVLGGPTTLPRQLEALDHAIRLNPTYADAYDLKANLLARAERFDEALEVCAGAGWPDQPPVTLQGRAAWIWAVRGDLRRAVDLMGGAVRREPSYFWGWSQLADWYEALDERAAALDAAEKMVALAPTDPVALVYLAEAQRLNGDTAEARRLLERVVQLEPAYDFAIRALFQLYLQAGEGERARDLIDRARPHLRPAETALMTMALELPRGGLKVAGAALAELCADEELTADQIGRARQAWRDARQEPDFTRRVEQSLLEGKGSGDLAVALVQPWLEQQSWRKVRSSLKRLLPARSAWNRVAVAYINALVESGTHERFRSFVREHREHLQQDAEAWGTVGWGLLNVEDHEEAVAWLEGWESQEGVVPWMTVNYVAALHALGRWEEALEVSRQSMRIEDDEAKCVHRVLLGFHEAHAGRVVQAARLLDLAAQPDLNLYHRFIHDLGRAMLTMRTGGPGALRRAARRLRQARHGLPSYHDNPVTRRFHRLAVRRVARLRGGGIGWLWGLGQRVLGR